MKERGLTTPTQQKDYLSDVRGAISLIDSDHPSLEIVNFDKETWSEINHHNSDRAVPGNAAIALPNELLSLFLTLMP